MSTKAVENDIEKEMENGEEIGQINDEEEEAKIVALALLKVIFKIFNHSNIRFYFEKWNPSNYLTNYCI